jgi:hypothetical protein
MVVSIAPQFQALKTLVRYLYFETFGERDILYLCGSLRTPKPILGKFDLLKIVAFCSTEKP